MKKIKYLIFTLTLLFVWLLVPNALVSTLSSSSTKVQQGQEFNISIVVSGLTNSLSSADYVLTFDSSKVSYVKTTPGQNKPASDITANVSGDTVYISYIDTQNGLTPMNNGTVVTITFKSNVDSGTAAFNLKGSGYADASGNDITGTTQNTTVSFYKPSSEALLKSLSVNDGSLSPEFSSDTKSYTLPDTELSKISISATASAGAKITGTGTKKLNYGTNTITITVTAEDGKTKNTYTIKVNRVDNRGSDSQLKNLTIEGIDFSFNANQYVYDIAIPENITVLNIQAEANDSKATIEGAGKIDIGLDTTSHTITVTAENGASTNYLIRFTNRSSESASSAKLTGLIINNININLDGSDTYLFGVAALVDSLNIKYETQSSTATVSIENADNLQPGINRVVIHVQDGEETKDYIILVHKLSNLLTLNSMAELQDSNFNQDTILILNSNESKTIPQDILKKLNNSKSRLYIYFVNEYQGLLGSFIIDNTIDSTSDLDLNILINNSTPVTLATRLKAGITVTYYLANIDTTGLSLYTYSSGDTTQTLLAETITNNNGYISFTTNGAERYVLTKKETSEEKAASAKKKSPFSFLSFISGFILGIGSYLGISYLLKNKDKLLKRQIAKPNTSVLLEEATPGVINLDSSPTSTDVPSSTTEQANVETLEVETDALNQDSTQSQ